MSISFQKIREIHFFQRKVPLENFWEVFWWWEKRRLPYNILVGLTGLVSCSLMLVIAEFAEKRSTEPSEPGSPLLIVIAIFGYGIMANVCYTGGWIAEIIATRIWKDRAANFGEISFTLGVIFSIGLTLLPPFLCFILVGVTLLNP